MIFDDDDDADARKRVPLTDFHCKKIHAAVVKRGCIYQRYEERVVHKKDDLLGEM